MSRGLSLVALLGISCLTPQHLTGGQAQVLKPSSHLTSRCYNFPDDNFSRDNNVKASYGASPHLVMSPGDTAIDFTLHDLAGTAWNLRNALEKGNGKPVVLIMGMATCPAYQGLNAEESDYRWTYWNEQNLVRAYGDKAIFVHIYGPEPHPTLPDTNFDAGKLLSNYWSLTRQHTTYKERVAAAKAIRPFTHPDQIILPDYLPGNPYSDLVQPVFCSYMMGARSSVVISTRGHIFFQQGWLNSDDLGTAIDAHIEQRGEGTWEGDQDPSPLAKVKAPSRKKKGQMNDRDPAPLAGVNTPGRQKQKGEEGDQDPVNLAGVNAPGRKKKDET